MMPRSHDHSGGRTRRTTNDLGVESVRGFIENLRDAIGGQSEAEITTRAGLEPGILRRILEYELLPAIDVVARLEEVLNADLWPRSRATSSARPRQDEASRRGS